MRTTSPFWLMFSQTLAVLFCGWIQWSLTDELSLILPLLGLLSTIFIHQVVLFRYDQLPKMPTDFKRYWIIAIGWSLQLTMVYCIFQPMDEVFRVAKVLPVLVVGLSIMDCVLLVCVAELVRQLLGD